MSVDIKQMAEAIEKAKANPDELAKVYKQYEDEIKNLSEKATKFEEVETKGIFKQLKETQDKLAEIEKAKKEAEEKEAKEKGEYKTLADQYLKAKEEAEAKLLETSKIAEQWTTYEKSRKEKLLNDLSKEDRETGELLPTLDALEKYVERLKATKQNSSSTNHSSKKQEDDKPIINYKTMTN